MKISIGEKLLTIREDRRLTQVEMADVLGISPSAYQRIEKNIVSPTIEQALSFSDKLGIGILDLLPETLSIQNRPDNQSGGVVFGNQTINYYYGIEKAIAAKDKEIEILKSELSELKSIIFNKNNNN